MVRWCYKIELGEPVNAGRKAVKPARLQPLMVGIPSPH